RQGLFDGCEVQRDRVFFSDVLGGSVVGGVTLFRGRVAAVGQIGRTSATFSVASDLILLDIELARNSYQATCVHTLFDSGCGLVKNAFGTNGSVAGGSTASVINWAAADAKYKQGSVTFTSGAANGVSATVKDVAAGTSLSLAYPLDAVPAAGD